MNKSVSFIQSKKKINNNDENTGSDYNKKIIKNIF